jgi:hypothetical protein
MESNVGTILERCARHLQPNSNPRREVKEASRLFSTSELDGFVEVMNCVQRGAGEVSMEKGPDVSCRDQDVGCRE